MRIKKGQNKFPFLQLVSPLKVRMVAVLPSLSVSSGGQHRGQHEDKEQTAIIMKNDPVNHEKSLVQMMSRQQDHEHPGHPLFVLYNFNVPVQLSDI